MRPSVRIAAIAGAVVLLAFMAVAVAVWTIDADQLVRPLLARVKAATGRDVIVGGRVDIRLGFRPTLVAREVRIGNASWAHAPDLLSATRVEAQVELLPLLRRRFELIRLALVEPVISLETDGHGAGNWELRAKSGGAPAQGEDPGAGTLGIEDLAIAGGSVTYRDGATGRETRVAIDNLSLRAPDARSPIVLQIRGAVDGIAVALSGEFGSFATLADARQPYPVAFRGQISGREVSVAAKIRRDAGLTTFQDIDAAFGLSSVRGRVDIRRGGTRPRWTVDLTSPVFAIADMPLARPTSPAPQRAPVGASKPKNRMFPDEPFPLAALLAVDADGNASIDRLVLSDAPPLERVLARFTLRDGTLDAPQVEAAAFGGTLTGTLKVDASRGKAPAIALRVDGHRLDVGALLAVAGVKREVRGGKTDVSVDVTMRGQSPHEWASSVSGRARAVVGPATLANTKLDPSLPFDRLAELVNPFRARTATTDLTCAVIRLPLANGVATVDRTIALETKEIDVSASGTLDFRSETLDLSFRPRIRRGIPVDIAQFASLVRLRGPFSAPTIVVDSVASAAAIARIGAAIGTSGLSLIGESLFASAADGGGACEVALGKSAARPTSPPADTPARARPPTGEDDLTKALKGLFRR